LLPFGGGEAGSPSNTMWPGPRPTYMPSLIFIYLIVWPQYTNVTDRQAIQTDRQTNNGLIAQGKPFYKRSPKNRWICRTGISVLTDCLCVVTIYSALWEIRAALLGIVWVWSIPSCYVHSVRYFNSHNGHTAHSPNSFPLTTKASHC